MHKFWLWFSATLFFINLYAIMGRYALSVVGLVASSYIFIAEWRRGDE